MRKLPKQWEDWCRDQKLSIHGRRFRKKRYDWMYLRGRGYYWRVNCHGEFQIGDSYEDFDRLVLVKINGTIVHEIDMSPKPYWQVCWSHGWSGAYASEEDANDYCFAVCGFYRSVREVKPSDPEYVNPDNPVLRTRTFFSKNDKQPLELIK